MFRATAEEYFNSRICYDGSNDAYDACVRPIGHFINLF